MFEGTSAHKNFRRVEPKIISSTSFILFPGRMFTQIIGMKNLNTQAINLQKKKDSVINKLTSSQFFAKSKLCRAFIIAYAGKWIGLSPSTYC